MFTPILSRLFFADKWNIGYVFQSTEDFISLEALQNINWLKEDTSLYAADPFVLVKNAKIYIFYEDLRKTFSNGKINVIQDLSFTTKKNVSGLSTCGHMSYPYIFQEGNDVYCIPETSSLKEVRLYKFTNDHFTEVSPCAVLIEGQEFIDTSIFKYQDRYWLVTSVKGQPQNNYIYYSSKLAGPYKAHKLNPLPADETGGRGAGSVFMSNGKLYRPTQNTKVRYGYSVIINRIDSLTTKSYSTKPIFEIRPKKPYNRGVHNISFADNLIVFDGKRAIFSPFMPLAKLLKRCRYYSNRLFKN
ncbi:hypothetical protein GCM10022392_05040 [Mucilaginibacter panaciglaebae]|uniref:Glucosamine inositolphosphorylceramide transferase 1 N-terminal domain-containing protein n=2 Tax=Mucilaginibacter panaciglaebae TaxID=502331 RepID=A0ABP7WFL2_9SPHI